MSSSPSPTGPQSSGEDLLAKKETQKFSLAELSIAEVRRRIQNVTPSGDAEKLTPVAVLGADGQHCALMRLDHPVQIQVDGPLGDYAFSHSDQCDVRLTGDVGAGVAESMKGGTIRIRGNAGVGAGAGMTGGTLAIYGNAGARCGAGMRGGAIFVRGSVGDEAGVGALGGMIVIGGDGGDNLGDAVSNVTVFIRGTVKSLADGVTVAPLRKREQLRLGLLLINASIRGDAKEFRRIVPIAMLEDELSKRGEVNPKWR